MTDFYLGDLQTRRIDVERARREGTLRGDPLIAPAHSNYPEGSIVDYFCLACGSVMCAHDENSDCWRVLKTAEELERYDAAKKICEDIEYGPSAAED